MESGFERYSFLANKQNLNMNQADYLPLTLTSVRMADLKGEGWSALAKATHFGIRVSRFVMCVA